MTDIGDSSGVSVVGYNALDDTPWYSSQEEVGGCKYVGNVLIECLDKKKTDIQLKEGTTMIGDLAFEGTKIYSLDFAKGIKIIGDRAFENCSNLSFAVIPDGVQYLGYDVFSSCKNLREIYVPESVERVQVEVFGNGIFDNYKNIAVPNHLSGMFIYNGRARIKYY